MCIFLSNNRREFTEHWLLLQIRNPKHELTGEMQRCITVFTSVFASDVADPRAECLMFCSTLCKLKVAFQKLGCFKILSSPSLVFLYWALWMLWRCNFFWRLHQFAWGMNVGLAGEAESWQPIKQVWRIPQHEEQSQQNLEAERQKNLVYLTWRPCHLGETWQDDAPSTPGVKVFSASPAEPII